MASYRSSIGRCIANAVFAEGGMGQHWQAPMFPLRHLVQTSSPIAAWSPAAPGLARLRGCRLQRL